MQGKTILLVAVILGLAGAFTVGLTTGLQQDSFTERQYSYISGVAAGGRFIVEAAPRNVDAHELCIREFYPDHPLELAGCIEVLEEREWRLP